MSHEAIWPLRYGIQHRAIVSLIDYGVVNVLALKALLAFFLPGTIPPRQNAGCADPADSRYGFKALRKPGSPEAL
ncbi:MAG: hypothetical protein CM1200mP36_04770 [Gammaproteobacteria bacterium]|nr:MAG: hypothetical protein CM1200mP36_04770 [Gammaproteobacteria bacterium]